MNFYTVLAVVILATATYATIQQQQQQQTYASSLSLEPPPPQPLSINGSFVDLSADDADRDISVDPLEELPANGTVTITTALATDLDINEFPPLGVSVIIQNDTITVTNQSVTVGPVAFAEADSDNGDNGGDGE